MVPQKRSRRAGDRLPVAHAVDATQPGSSVPAGGDRGSPLTFTVVMTVFQRPELVMPALFAVVNQTYPHWNLAVYADGPHPRVREMLASYIEAEPDRANSISFTVCARMEKLWGNRLRARGIAEAEGDYTVILGHDCTMLPGYLAAHVENITAEPGCLSMVGVAHWTDRAMNGNPDERYPHPRYSGEWPKKGFQNLKEHGPRDGVDLLCMAFPTSRARDLQLFGPAVEHRYGADYLAYVACREAMPVRHRPGVVAAHF